MQNLTFTRKLDYVAHGAMVAIVAVALWGWQAYPQNIDENFGKLAPAMMVWPLVIVYQAWLLYGFARSPEQVSIDADNQQLKINGEDFYPLEQLDMLKVSYMGYRYKVKIVQSGKTVFKTGHCYTTLTDKEEVENWVRHRLKGAFHAWNK
ncbi:hypothetical protein [Alteromonas gilva]|uniref:FACT complex subunit SSRP1/POB3 N-terminal PH domain-containing protein n=1 Tax=Alteromonas gilva TaxID=2987522 RepID=A0ABT5L6T2_9ALTE|nr:hypothetical protein [Alteromonas gilva]MDC8832775.1 hypothetical protein [Alteromonas gilva]